MARGKWVAGNWKMNGSQAFAQQLLNAVTADQALLQPTKVIILPPFVYLSAVAAQLANTHVAWGAQTLSEHEQGAYTGEICGDMLKDLGCQYVLVGHSERRSLYNESNQQVAQKFKAAQQHGLTPILCVGETLQQREQQQTFEVVLEQLDAVVSYNGVASLANAMIAYEPVWAIGTGLTATSEQAQEVHQLIRQYLAKQDAALAQQLPILYGGSVKPSNAGELFAMPDIDGGLIGGASLNSADFLAIIAEADKVAA